MLKSPWSTLKFCGLSTHVVQLPLLCDFSLAYLPEAGWQSGRTLSPSEPDMSNDMKENPLNRHFKKAY